MSKARITTVCTVAHQGEGDPTAAESRFSLTVGEEQPYVRRCTVGEDWKPLDCGWVEEASCLVLSNEEGKGLQANPTAEEKEAIAARVVELGISLGFAGGSAPSVEPFALVPPGESARFRPTDPGGLWVRCRKGTARVTIYLFPR